MKQIKLTNRLMQVCLLTIFIFTACKKASVNQSATPVHLIKSIVYTDNTGTASRLNYTYTGNNADSVYGGPYDGRFKYRYTTDSVLVKLIDGAGQYNSTDRYFISSNGLTQSVISDDRFGVVFFSKTFEYDANKLLVRVTIPAQNYEGRYFYTGMRMDSILEYYSGRLARKEIIEQVDPSITNTLGNANYGKPWLGATPQTILKSTKYTYRSNGTTLAVTYVNSYTVNALGQITKVIITISSAGSSSTSTNSRDITYY